MKSMDNRPPLDEIFDSLWSELQRGVAAARHPFHTPALATLSAAGPAVRTVVLRHADRAGRRLLCHTDLRSPKVAELLGNPRAAWMFYDRERKTQVRLQGKVELHHRDTMAHERWAAATGRSRQCYQEHLAPGTPLDTATGLPWRAEEGFANFVVIECRIEKIDWLYLRSGGHWRAGFNWRADSWKSAWIAP